MKKFAFLYIFFISTGLFAANVNLLLQNDGLGAGTVTVGGPGILQTCSNVTGTGCSLTIPSGTEIKITALPQSGTTFQSWTAGTEGSKFNASLFVLTSTPFCTAAAF